MAQAQQEESKENVITPEEFQELEKKETRKIKLKKPREEKPPQPAPRPARHEATDTEMLLLKTEKLEGRLETMGDFRKAVDERISSLNQEIGELRSSIMEKDKALREVQQGFSRIREMAEGMEPERITSQLASKDEGIEKNLAAIESLGLQVKQLRKDVRANSGLLESIRDIRNVASLVQKMTKKMGKIDEDRKYTSRMAAKVESMFTDLSDRLGEFQSYKDKISFNEETMHEVMKTMDMLESRLQDSPRKDDLKKLESSLEESIEKARTASDDGLYDLRRLLDDLLTALRDAGIKGVLDRIGRVNLERSFATKDDIEEIRSRLDVLRGATTDVAERKRKEFEKTKEKDTARAKTESPFIKLEDASFAGTARPRADEKESPVRGIQERVDSLIDQAEEAIKLGNLDIAKNLYREALSLYNQLNQAETYQEAVGIYSKIKRLYSRLRIYT